MEFVAFFGSIVLSVSGSSQQCGQDRNRIETPEIKKPLSIDINDQRASKNSEKESKSNRNKYTTEQTGQRVLEQAEERAQVKVLQETNDLGQPIHETVSTQ